MSVAVGDRTWPASPKVARQLAGVGAFAATAGCCVEIKLPLLTVAAQWVPLVYRRVELDASDVAMVLAVVLGLLGRSPSERLAKSIARRSNAVQLLGLTLVGLLALSAVDAVVPLLSVARTAEVGIGIAFVLTSIRLPELRAWILHACRLVILIELPLVLLQLITQSTFPRETILLGRTAEVPVGAPGAWAIVGADGMRWQRALGSFPHPNVLGGFAALVIVLLAPRLFGGATSPRPLRRRVPFGCLSTRWRGGIEFEVPRRLDLAIWLAAWVELLLSFSRAAALAALLGCAVTLVRWPASRSHRPRWRKVAVLIAIAVVVMIAATVRSTTFGVGRLDPAVSDRLALVSIAFGLVVAHPLLGVGAGNFSIVESMPPIDGAFVDPVHCVPLLVAAEAGVVAGFLWLGLTVMPALRARATGDAGDPASRLVAGVTLVLLVLAGLDHYLWTLAAGRMVFWIALVSLYSSGAIDANGTLTTQAPNRSESAVGVRP
jgi:O-antigen ligase